MWSLVEIIFELESFFRTLNDVKVHFHMTEEDLRLVKIEKGAPNNSISVLPVDQVMSRVEIDSLRCFLTNV